MPITRGSVITWGDLTNKMLDAIKNTCCNIDQYDATVPERLKSGQTRVAIKSLTSSATGKAGPSTQTWYANPENLIYIVTSDTVRTEWNDFLTDAGLNTKMNVIIQNYDFNLIIGLIQQFMSFHIKPVCNNRTIYNEIEPNPGFFSSSRYVTGIFTPKYTVSVIDKDITDSKLLKSARQTITNDGIDWGVFSRNEDPKFYRSYLN